MCGDILTALTMSQHITISIPFAHAYFCVFGSGLCGKHTYPMEMGYVNKALPPLSHPHHTDISLHVPFVVMNSTSD